MRKYAVEFYSGGVLVPDGMGCQEYKNGCLIGVGHGYARDKDDAILKAEMQALCRGKKFTYTVAYEVL